MNASSWKRATDQIAQQTQEIQQTQPAATTDSNQLASFPLSALSLDESGPPEVHHGTELPLAASIPRATTTPAGDSHAYCQIIPGVSQHLYPTITVDGLLEAAQADNGPTLHDQISIELNKYLKEATQKCQAEVNYYDRHHQSTNTSHTLQEDNVLKAI